MHLGAASVLLLRGRATVKLRGFHHLSRLCKLRMRMKVYTLSEGTGSKVRVREEKNPDHRLRSPNDR